MQNHYQILGLEPDASTDEVKKAYKKLAKKFLAFVGVRQTKSLTSRKVEALPLLASSPPTPSRPNPHESTGKSTKTDRQ